MNKPHLRKWLGLGKLWDSLFANWEYKRTSARAFLGEILEPGESSSHRRRKVQLQLEPLEDRWLFSVSFQTVIPPISATEGQSASFAVSISYSGSFTDYIAVVNWDDGSTSVASITGNDALHTGTVTGSHIYSVEPGSLPGSPPQYTVTISGDGSSATAQANVTLSDAVIGNPVNGPTINGGPNAALNNVLIGSFTDPDPKGQASDFTGTINWGDSTTSAAIFVFASGTSSSAIFNVLGSHTYNAAGNYSITVSPLDNNPPPSGNSVSLSTSANISTSNFWILGLLTGTTDPGQGFGVPTGPGSGSPENGSPGSNGGTGSNNNPGGEDISPNDGNVNGDNPFDTSQSPPCCGADNVAEGGTPAGDNQGGGDSGIVNNGTDSTACCGADNTGADGGDGMNSTGGWGEGSDMGGDFGGTSSGTGFADNAHSYSLDYNSNTVSAQPIFVATLNSDPAVTVQNIQATLTWDSVTQATVTYNAQTAGSTYWLPLQEANAATSGLHTWTFAITVNKSGGGTITTSASGSLFVQANDNSSNPIGAGWSIGGLDHLFVASNGDVYWVSGRTGGTRYFQKTGSTSFQSPANDFGSLVNNGSGYTYTAIDQTQLKFGVPSNNISLLTSKTDIHGLTVTFSYSSGLLSTITGPDGGVTTFVYQNSLLVNIDEPGSRVVTLTHSSGDLTGITNPDGNTRSFSYNSHRLTNDQWGPTNTTINYDTHGRASSVNMGNNSLGQPNNLTVAPAVEQGISGGTTIDKGVGVLTDALSHPVTYGFDGLGRLTKMVTADGATQTWVRNSAGLVISYTDGNLKTSYSTYNGPDRTRVDTPDGADWLFAYDTTFHHRTQTTDPLGNVTQYALNSTGDVTTITFADGTVQKRGWSSGLMTSQTDQLNHTTSYLYDTSRRLTEMDDAAGARITYAYDSAGNRTFVKDALGHVTTSAYDGMRRLTSQTDANGGIITMAYNALGRVTSQYDQLGHQTTYAYDVHGWQTAFTEAVGTSVQRTNTMVYDAVGNILYTQDPLLHITSYGYDARNRQNQVIGANGTSDQTTATMVYDQAGNLISETNGISTVTTYAHQSTTNYAYDALHRQTQVTEGVGSPVQRLTTTVYDLTGNVLQTSDGLGHVTRYNYDQLNRQNIVFRAWQLPEQTVSTLAYDSAGNLLSETDGWSATATYVHLSVTSYAYDTDNRQTAVTQGVGSSQPLTTTTAYDLAGNVRSTTDGAGDVTSYGYDVLNRQNQVIRGQNSTLSSTSTMVYDKAGNLVSQTDGISSLTNYAHQTATSYGYDALNRQNQVIRGFGSAVASTTTMVYDLAGNLTSQTTGQSTTVAYNHPETTQSAYDNLNRQTRQTDALGHIVTSVFDAAGNVIRTVDALNNSTTITYDALNRQVSTQDPTGGINTTSYDAADNVTQTTDALNHSMSYGFDGLNRQTSATDARGGITTTGYDAAGNAVQIIDSSPQHNQTTYAFDALNRQTSMTDQLGNHGTMTYDAAGRLITSKDRDGRTRNFSYDALNRKTAETWLNSSQTTVNLLTYGYDAADNLLTSADYHGAYTMAYDALNRMTSDQEPFGQILTYGYDAVGNRTLVHDSLAGVTTSVYDADNNLVTRIFGGVGQIPLRVDYTYTARNQVASMTYSLLAAEDLSSVNSGTGGWTVSVDGGSPSVWATLAGSQNWTKILLGDFNGDGLTDILGYDSSSSKWYVVQSAGSSFTINLWLTWTLPTGATLLQGDFNGDGRGDFTAFDPATGKWWVALSTGSSFQTPALWSTWNSSVTWVVTVGDFNGDGLTDVAGFVPASGEWWIGLSTGSSVSVSKWTTWNSTVTWTIRLGDFNGDGMTDVAGFVAASGEWWVGLSTGSSFSTTKWTTWNNTVTWVDILVGDFNGDGKADITSRVLASGEWWTAVSNGTSFATTKWVTWSTAVTWVEVQLGDFNGDGRSDLLGRISGTGQWWIGQSTGSSFTSISWSSYSSSVTWVDSLAGNYYHRGVTANYGYDNAGRLTTLTYQQVGGAGSSLATYAYGYDLGNRLTTETLNSGAPTSYAYDTTNQLTTVVNASGTTTYGYDLNGNRTNTGYVTGSENQLTADATYSYTYDAEGNLITKTNKSTAEQWTFGYDNLNHMTSAIDKNSSGTTLTYATYVYDVFGNRIEKDVWTQSGGSTTTTRMGYDGLSIWADLSSGNALLARYLRGDQIDNLIARIVTSGSTPMASWYLPDRLGSIRNITDASGNPIDTITYDGFGNVTNETNTTAGDRWKYTGRELDSETGLQYNRARYYNGPDGRWTSQDPLGFGGGDGNLYEYVKNAPVNNLDPLGLANFLTFVVVKSYIAPIGKRIIGYNALFWPIQARVRLLSLAWLTDQQFSENPLNDSKDKGYRLYSQKMFCFCCTGDKLVHWSETPIETDTGKEGFLSAPAGIVWGESTYRKDQSTVKFFWSFKGRPNVLVEPMFQAVHPRFSRWIWHSVFGELSCKNNKGFHDVDIVGSRFPSHRLFVNGTIEKTIAQGPFSYLWISLPSDWSMVF